MNRIWFGGGGLVEERMKIPWMKILRMDDELGQDDGWWEWENKGGGGRRSFSPPIGLPYSASCLLGLVEANLQARWWRSCELAIGRTHLQSVVKARWSPSTTTTVPLAVSQGMMIFSIPFAARPQLGWIDTLVGIGSSLPAIAATPEASLLQRRHAAHHHDYSLSLSPESSFLLYCAATGGWCVVWPGFTRL